MALKTAAQICQDQGGGAMTAAGTAIAAVPNPMAASTPAARRCSSIVLRIRTM
jgi:hypothetical protein